MCIVYINTSGAILHLNELLHLCHAFDGNLIASLVDIQRIIGANAK
jgi:hypothetical protein